MRYLIALPICIFLISGGVWLLARGGAHELPAGEITDRARDSADDRESQSPQTKTTSVRLGQIEDSAAIGGPILVGPCTLAPIEEQIISSQLDGVIDALNVRLGAKVNRNDCLAELDARKILGKIEKLRIRASSDAAERIALALFNEADAKVKYAEKANRGGLKSVPELEYKTYFAQRERYAQEIKKAREDRLEAAKELKNAELILSLHKLQSRLNGEVVKVWKKSGETVRQAEPLFRVANIDRLLIEGFCRVQHAGRLKKGMVVQVEPDEQGAQLGELVGHTAAVEDIAVASDGKLVASGSKDNTVMLWSHPSGKRLAVLPHPAEVHSVDLVATGKEQYLLASGCADHRIRIWRIASGVVKGPVHLLRGHNRPIRSVRISSDGRLCATGAEDRRVGLWNLKTGQRICWVHHLGAWKQAAHQGAATSVRFGPKGSLTTAGTDNVVKVWKIEKNKCSLVTTHRGRTGDVENLDIRKDGRAVLFDHGEELRILDRKTGAVLGALRSRKQVRFKGFARFSPSGDMVLTTSANGRIQLWQMQQSDARTAVVKRTNHSAARDGIELRHYHAPRSAAVCCGAFAPDETVFFTGCADHAIRVWEIPAPSARRMYSAVLTYVGSQIEQGTDLVRVQAELDNSTGRRLRPGTFVTLRIHPAIVDQEKTARNRD